MNFIIRERTFGNFIRCHRAYVDYDDPHVLVRDLRLPVYNLLNTGLVLNLRLIICFVVQFVKFNDQTEDEILQDFYFCSKTERILSRYQIFDVIDECFRYILNSIENFIHNGSNWIIKKIFFVDVHVGRYRGFRGGCKNVRLPDEIKNKKAVLHIKCEDDMCFLYCVCAKLYPAKNNVNKPSSYKKNLRNFDTRHLKFPVGKTEIKKFEKNNCFRINDFGYEESLKVIYPIYFSKQNVDFTEIDLLLYNNH